MTSRELPVVSYVFESGADDRVFDWLLLTGPLVIAVAVLLGRSIATELLAVAYIAVFVGYTLYQGLSARGGRQRR